MTCAQLWTKTRTSISREICCVKSGFQILFAVEQLVHYFQKTNKSKGYTYTKPMIRLPRACRAKKGSFIHRFSPVNDRRLCMLMSPIKGKTAVHGCHCRRGMAVRSREVMARPWVGVYVPLALIYW